MLSYVSHSLCDVLGGGGVVVPLLGTLPSFFVGLRLPMPIPGLGSFVCLGVCVSSSPPKHLSKHFYLRHS